MCKTERLEIISCGFNKLPSSDEKISCDVCATGSKRLDFEVGYFLIH
jgi:hypothetical protein